MKRLGYARYVAQGGDWGAGIVQAMGRQAPSGLLGIHTNLPATVPNEIGPALGGGPLPAGITDEERATVDALKAFGHSGGLAYVTMMNARPQAVGYGLTDSPAGLAGFMLVHPGFEHWSVRRRIPSSRRRETKCWTTSRCTGCRTARPRPRGSTGRTADGTSSSRARSRPTRSRSRSPSPCFRRRSIEPRRHGPGAPSAT